MEKIRFRRICFFIKCSVFFFLSENLAFGIEETGSSAAVQSSNKYFFSLEPVDVVIPCVEKDLPTLQLCIRGVRNYYKNVRRIIIVSARKITDEAEWFPESRFPFSFRDVAVHLCKSEQVADQYLKMSKNRCGWYFQQLLKLYAPFVIPNISTNVLIVDADVVFLKPISFQDEIGNPILNVGKENNPPYFQHMNSLLPGLKREIEEYSGIYHCMLFQRSVLEDLFNEVESFHNDSFWKVFCNCVGPDQLYGSGASEYEIYFNFIISRMPDVKISPLRWINVNSLKEIQRYKQSNLAYVACHAYSRAD